LPEDVCAQTFSTPFPMRDNSNHTP
jgi:hypothetical protein